MSRVTRHEMVAIRTLQFREETKHFCYRPVCLADAYPLHAAAEHPDFCRYLDWPAPATLDACTARVRALMEEELVNASAAACVVDKATGRWRGILRWTPLQESLALDLWASHGIWEMDHGVEELLDQILAHAFRVTSLDMLHCMVHRNDARMVALVENSGMHSHASIGDRRIFGIGHESF